MRFRLCEADLLLVKALFSLRAKFSLGERVFAFARVGTAKKYFIEGKCR